MFRLLAYTNAAVGFNALIGNLTLQEAAVGFCAMALLWWIAGIAAHGWISEIQYLHARIERLLKLQQEG
jgi:hypothetical protein